MEKQNMEIGSGIKKLRFIFILFPIIYIVIDFMIGKNPSSNIGWNALSNDFVLLVIGFFLYLLIGKDG